MTFQNLKCHLSVAPGAGKTYTITLFVNDVATALSTIISGATDVWGFDLVHKVYTKNLDLVYFEVIGSAACAGSDVHGYVEGVL